MSIKDHTFVGMQIRSINRDSSVRLKDDLTDPKREIRFRKRINLHGIIVILICLSIITSNKEFGIMSSSRHQFVDSMRMRVESSHVFQKTIFSDKKNNITSTYSRSKFSFFYFQRMLFIEYYYNYEFT